MSNKPNLKSNRTSTPVSGSPKGGFLRSPATWIFVLVLLAAVIAVAVAADSRDAAEEASIPQTAFAETIGDPLPSFTNPDSAVDLVAPTISAQTLQGDRVTLQPDGTARLYGFFAHWCPHCQAELPTTARWLEDNPLPSDTEVIAISTAVDNTATNYPPSAWFAREDWPATVLLDSADNAISNGYGLTSFPYWVAVDGDGKVISRISGQIDTNQLEAFVDALSDG